LLVGGSRGDGDLGVGELQVGVEVSWLGVGDSWGVMVWSGWLLVLDALWVARNGINLGICVPVGDDGLFQLCST
jgi:hypothetical protein